MRVKFSLFTFLLALVLSAPSSLGATWIDLNNQGEVRVPDDSSLDGFSKATWSMWVKQDSLTDKAGLFGKYAARSGKRSYLIRNTDKNGVYVVLSSDGTNIGTYSSMVSKACGIRAN